MIDKELIGYIKGKKHLLVLIVTFSFLGLVTSVSTTYLLSTSVFSFIDGKNDVGTYYLLGGIGLAVVFVIFYILKGKMAGKLADYVSTKIREDIFDKYVQLNGHSKLKIQEISQLSSEGVEQLRLYYSSYLPSFFYAMIAPISLFVLFCFFNYKVALLYLFCVPLIPISIILVSKWAKKIFATYWNKYLALGGAYLDSVSGMKELLIFHYDKKMEDEMKKNSEEFRRITMKVLVMQLFSTTIMDIVAYGGAAVGIVLTLFAFKNSEINSVITLFLILVGAEFFLPMRSLGSAFHIAMNGATAGKKVISLLKEEPVKNGTLKIDSISTISLENVSFHYEDTNLNTLSNINMNLNKGLIAVIGDSGCGKSTLAKILTKQIQTYSGHILIDGKELKDINIYDFRKHTCYVALDTYLLHLSISDAFHFYNPNLSDEEMLSLLEMVSLKERILDSGGLSYIPKEGASDLSGGEKQRLVLSYYLSSKKDFYVFDETTSNIDKESEEIILSTIKDLSKDHIVLFISHRLKNALYADEIYLFNSDKKSLTFGKPDELLSNCDFFRQGIENENKWEEIL